MSQAISGRPRLVDVAIMVREERMVELAILFLSTEGWSQPRS